MTKQRKVIAIVLNLLCMFVYLGAAIATIMGKGTTSLLLSFAICSYNVGAIAWVLNTRTKE